MIPKMKLFYLLISTSLLASCGGRPSLGEKPRYYDASVVKQKDLGPGHYKALPAVLDKRIGSRPLKSEDPSGALTAVTVAQLSGASRQALYLAFETVDPDFLEVDLRIRLADDTRVPVTVRRGEKSGLIVREGKAGAAFVHGTTTAVAERHGIGRLIDDGSPWNPRALEVLDLALSSLSAPERAVLRGIPFTRKTRGDDAQHGALYVQRDCAASIFIFDVAFRADQDQFVGTPEAPWPTSTRTFLHEVGHAIHERPGRDGMCKLMADQRKYNARTLQLRARIEAFNRGSRKGADQKTENAAIEVERDAVEKSLKAFERNHQEVQRLQKKSPILSSYAKALGQSSPPTRYAETSMKESFAESFSLYRADPEALRRLLPAVFAYFERGEHTTGL